MNQNLSKRLSQLLGRTGKASRRQSYVRPALERLEDRDLPSNAPLLAISPNGRYLVNASNGQPFYLIGDTAWALPAGITTGAATDTNTANYYFQTRAGQGYNAVLMDADVQLGASPVGAPSRGPLDVNGNAPFNGTLPDGNYDVSTVPAAGDTTSTAAKYWQNVHNIVAAAASYGIDVVLDAYDNYNPWFTGGNSPNSTAKLATYGQFLGKEFADLPNIIWMWGNDYSENSAGDADLAAVVQGIRQFDNTHIGWATDEFGPSFDNSVLRQTTTLNSIYEYSPGPWRSLYLSQYNRSDFGPIFNIESGYEFNTSLGVSEADLRNEHYSFLLAGATGDMYGNEDIWPFDDAWRSWQNALTTEGAHEMTYLANFVNSIAWQNLTPDQTGRGEPTTLFQNVGSPTDYSGAFIGNANGTSVTLALAYKPSTGTGTQSFTVSDMSRFVGSVSAQWYDPTNGNTINIGTFANSGSHTFTTPGTNSQGQNDFLLVLKSAATVPAAPTGVTATPANGAVTLSWNTSLGAVSYNIYRSTASGAEVKIATNPATITTTSYTDTGLTNGITYFYKVTAVNSAGESPLASSTEVSATPVLSAPTTPTNLTAASGNNQVTLTWSAVAGATSYSIYRSTSPNGEAKIITNPPAITGTTYTDTGLTNGTTYYYKITAVNSAGESALSSEAAATPSAVAYVQSASTGSDGSGGNISQSFNANTSAGDLIVVVVSWDTSTGNTAAPTITDSQGNTYTVATYANDTRHNQALAVFYAPAIKGGADTITATFPVSQAYRRLQIEEYRGLAGTVDVTSSNIGTGSVPTSNSATATTGGDLIFGTFMDDSGTTTITAGAGFTQRQFVSGDSASEDTIQASAGSIAATANVAASTDYLAQMVAFKAGGTTVAPPTITTQPSNVTVNAGQSATFTVAATGPGTLTYQWQKLINGTWVNVSSSNTSPFTGATSPTFTITAPVASDAGSYWVVVSNAGGNAVSNTVTLTVNAVATAPSITMQPASQTVSAGQTVSFTATASGTPTPTVQWQLSTNGGATWSNISGATSTTYSFTAAITQSGNEYRAVFTNSAGSATTNAATLTVNAVAVAPSITTQPTSQTVMAGQSVSLKAAASGTPAPTVQWQVSANGGSTWSNVSGATSTTFSFTASATQNGNEYRAVFTNSAGSATTNAATLTINAANPAPTFVQANAQQTHVASNAVTLNTASGTGNTVVVEVDFSSSVNFTSISDNQGNIYTEIGTQQTSASFGGSSRLYYATSIKGGALTVTSTLSGTPGFHEVYVVEYAGVDTTSPVEGFSVNVGTGSSFTSKNVTTTVANDLLFGIEIDSAVGSAAAGWTPRSTLDSNVAADKVAASTGSYAFTGSSSGAFISWIVAFKADPPAGSSKLVAAINAGGGVTGPFAADTNVSGGNTFSTTAGINTSNALNPAPASVYQSERYGNFTYTISNLTPGGSYIAQLDFAEIYWNSAGSRIFNVVINGTPVLTNFDIFASAGGNNIAIDEQIPVHADSNGKITIQFITVKDNAKLSGLEIYSIV